MRTLVLDIETRPSLAHVWSIWNVNVGLPQLLEAGELLCFAAKFTDEDKVRFHRGPGMVKAAHRLLNEADALVTYNGKKFDEPHLRSMFVKAGLTAPSAYVSIDLCAIVKREFRFVSNKLEHVATQLLNEGKAPTGGHQLWIDCMAGKRDAWTRMQSYNEQDVLLTERLYHRLAPWIKHPNPALYGDAKPGEVTCPQCGGNKVRKRGLSYTQLCSYQRYLCDDCGRYSRGKHQLEGVNAR